MVSHNAKTKEAKPVSLVWLRRDLRLTDHAPLAAAQKAGLPVQLVFVFDTDILMRFSNPDDRRLSFIADTLCLMHEEIKEYGAGIRMLHGRAEELIPKLAQELNAKTVFAGADFEPGTRERDKKVYMALEKSGIGFMRLKEHLLFAPHEVLKADGSPYKVFTPYANAWRQKAAGGELFGEHKVTKGGYADYAQLRQFTDNFPLLDCTQGAKQLLQPIGYNWQEVTLWPAQDGQKRLKEFVRNPLKAYNVQRNFMGNHGTSRLSPYLRFGLVSIRECARLASFHETAGAATWLNELIWRDFYAMIMFHFPETTHLEFQEQTRGLHWNDDKTLLKAFTDGITGYPVIDAAMRELSTTGYMHNRARMIVASFMTKDLLLDWRLGEEHFAQWLMDYEQSSNVGGWQWAASTGTDAQPYFRVFNPVLQSKRFDPEGKYIRAFVPELAHMGASDIHEPWLHERPKAYPRPIVNHAEMKEKAIQMFRKAPQ